MNISNVGIELIKKFEGCRLNAYKPVPWEQYYTIGWGHYGADVYEGMTITQQQADNMLINDLKRYVEAVKNAPLGFRPTQNQFDALVSFCYNLGTGIMEDFRGMTATQVSNEIPLYNKAGGQVLEGLVRRRKEEKELFDKDLVITSPSNSGGEYIISEKSENGIFYPSETIWFRNQPNTDNWSDVVDTYTAGEYVVYDKVVTTNKYVWISWVSASNGIRRYMPVREYNNGVYGKLWGRIE